MEWEWFLLHVYAVFGKRDATNRHHQQQPTVELRPALAREPEPHHHPSSIVLATLRLSAIVFYVQWLIGPKQKQTIGKTTNDSSDSKILSIKYKKLTKSFKISIQWSCFGVVCDHLQPIVVVSRPVDEILKRYVSVSLFFFVSIYFSSLATKHNKNK